MLAIKIEEGQSRCQFIGYKRAKCSRCLYAFNSNPYFRQELCRFMFANQLFIDANALTKRVQVGLCIESCAHPSLTQHALYKRRSRTFPFCAGNQRIAITQVWVAESLQ